MVCREWGSQHLIWGLSSFLTCMFLSGPLDWVHPVPGDSKAGRSETLSCFTQTVQVTLPEERGMLNDVFFGNTRTALLPFCSRIS